MFEAGPSLAHPAVVFVPLIRPDPHLAECPVSVETRPWGRHGSCCQKSPLSFLVSQERRGEETWAPPARASVCGRGPPDCGVEGGCQLEGGPGAHASALGTRPELAGSHCDPARTRQTGRPQGQEGAAVPVITVSRGRLTTGCHGLRQTTR